ncbi:hypothetical protein [Allosphingosinicella sp.]|uniref:hypothetical protein n=1 Tax=Allosphingosinicella sp. TaxID=2823234 RepID=UPI00378475CE
MRITWALLLLAGCAGTPAGTNGTADKAPPQAPAPPPAPGPTADSYRPAIEANEAPFRERGALVVHLNEEVRVGDIRVKVLEVLEDSRCPPDVACVWAGRVRLRVQVNGGAEQVLGTDQPVRVGRQQVELVGVAPINWAHPPAGVDPNEPKRFALRLRIFD